MVEDATPEEIDAAVAGVTATPPTDTAEEEDTAADETAEEEEFCGVVTVTVPASAPTAAPTAIEAPAAVETPAPTTTGSEPLPWTLKINNRETNMISDNVQSFTGTLGGPAPPVISSAGDRPFTVNGNTFVNVGGALQRSCAVSEPLPILTLFDSNSLQIQHNACADAANSGSLAGGVGQCETQEAACNAAA